MIQTKLHIASFSLFESVIAISVIGVLIGLGTLIYSNIVKAERPVSVYQALEEIDLHLENLKATGLFIPEIFESENYRIEQNIQLHNGNKKLYLVEYVVFVQEKKWHSEKHLISNPSYAN